MASGASAGSSAGRQTSIFFIAPTQRSLRKPPCFDSDPLLGLLPTTTTDLDPTISFTSFDCLSIPTHQDIDWMGSTTNINDYSSWGQGPAADIFNDLIPNHTASSTQASSFVNGPSSQSFYTNNLSPIPASEPLSRTHSETISSSSPDTHSNPDDHSSTSRSPNVVNHTPSPHQHTTNSNSKVKKRTLNTLAARRYRQKRVDQMQSLESTLKETESERDELKLRVARLEAEVDVLRGLVSKKS